MAGLEDIIRSSAPGGNIGKPLMLALLALLASGALFGGGGAGRPASTGAQPSSDEGGGGLLGGLGGLLDKLQKGGLGDVANSWVGPGQNQPASHGQLGSALGPDIIKTLASAIRPLRGGNHQAALSNSAGGRRQTDPEWSPADIGGVVSVVR